jgi:hypothetical protein
VPFTQDGLPDLGYGPGRTAHFEFNYEDSLSDARGKDLVTAVMSCIEGDWLWLRSFLSGQFFNPLNGLVYIHVHQRTSPMDPLGASWQGLGLIPFNVEVWLGEVPLFGIAPANAARMLLISELSEMLMRDSYLPAAPNPWFGLTNEGNKGEALSRVFAMEFLRAYVPGTTTTGFTSVSSLWLDAPPRSDTTPSALATNADDPGFDVRNGIGTLFLMFLHDERGFSLEWIIQHGATETRGFPSTGTLADVYQNLTGQPAGGAFKEFSDLVDLHYPSADGPYGAPLDTVFPVPDLARLDAEWSRLTWGVSNGPPPRLYVVMTKPAVVPTTVHLTSSGPGVLPVPQTALVFPPTDVCTVPLTVTPQPAAFTEEVVTLTVTYAGKTLTHEFTVVRPEDLLPPLRIVAEADHPCARLFQEGEALTLRVDNVDVFVDRKQLTYAWAVTGAAAAALNAPVLEIAALPSTGTAVKVSVQVTNEDGVTGHGELDFTALAPLKPLAELDRLVRCKLATTAAIVPYIPPWVPVEAGPLTSERVVSLRRLLRAQRATFSDLDKSLSELELGLRAQGPGN